MRVTVITLAMLLASHMCHGQRYSIPKNSPNGQVSFGVRTTESLFASSGMYWGLGAGWQLRYRIAEKFNTEWFADWITTDLNGLGQRKDAHIGVSAMIYPGKNVDRKKSVSPYLLGGFCADYTRISTNPFLELDGISNAYIVDTHIHDKDRLSFATQLGLGTSYRLTERFDLSLSAQYVLHFGDDIHVVKEQTTMTTEFMYIEDAHGGNLEGHLFVCLSANFIVFDLNKTK